MGLLIATVIGLSTAGVPPTLPSDVVVLTDKDAYSGKDHISVTLHNRSKRAVKVNPHIYFERGRGDGTYAPVYKLRVVKTCPLKPPQKLGCVTLKANQKMILASWDWNTGGYTQCPPRRPGHRAFKGVHRIILTECAAKKKNAPPPRQRIKLVTWE